MKAQHPKGRIVLVCFVVLSVVLSSASLILLVMDKASEAHLQDQYVLYIGTNDKDTNVQELSFDECRRRVEKVCLQYVPAVTITAANGVWTADSGDIAYEETLVCCINGAEKADMDAIADQLLAELNQYSIMIEHRRVSYTFRTS